MKLYNEKKEAFEIDESKLVGIGRSGKVYMISDDTATKILNLNGFQIITDNKLKAMIASSEGKDTSFLAWPKEILYYENGRFAGYTMPYIKGSNLHDNIFNMDLNWKERVLLAIKLSDAVEKYHKMGHVVGDIEPCNVMYDEKGMLYLIATDSFNVTDPNTKEVYRCFEGLLDFLAPEVPGIPDSQESDYFSLAVCIYVLLSYGDNPFGGHYVRNDYISTYHRVNLRKGKCILFPETYENDRFPFESIPDFALELEKVFPQEICDLFRKTFIDGLNEPNKRATSEEWKNALSKLLTNLVQCEKNTNHYYHKDLKECPLCRNEKIMWHRIKQYLIKPEGTDKYETAENLYDILGEINPKCLNTNLPSHIYLDYAKKGKEEYEKRNNSSALFDTLNSLDPYRHCAESFSLYEEVFKNEDTKAEYDKYLICKQRCSVLKHAVKDIIDGQMSDSKYWDYVKELCKCRLNPIYAYVILNAYLYIENKRFIPSRYIDNSFCTKPTEFEFREYSTCRNCGSITKKSEYTCSKCGLNLDIMCPKCHADLSDCADKDFCKCGYDIRKYDRARALFVEHLDNISENKLNNENWRITGYYDFHYRNSKGDLEAVKVPIKSPPLSIKEKETLERQKRLINERFLSASRKEAKLKAKDREDTSQPKQNK